MKKLILILALCMVCNQTQAIQSYSSAMGGGDYYPSQQNVKVYDQYGSYQGQYKKQSNGTVKQYDKYGSYQGYYKQDGSKTKYYQSNAKRGD